MRFDDDTRLTLFAKLPADKTPWPSGLDRPPCTLGRHDDQAVSVWWTPLQRLVLGAFAPPADDLAGLQQLDVTSQFTVMHIPPNSHAPAVSSVLHALTTAPTPGQAVRTLYGPHRVAALHLGSDGVVLICLTCEVHLVRARLAQRAAP